MVSSYDGMFSILWLSRPSRMEKAANAYNEYDGKFAIDRVRRRKFVA